MKRRSVTRDQPSPSLHHNVEPARLECVEETESTAERWSGDATMLKSIHGVKERGGREREEVHREKLRCPKLKQLRSAQRGTHKRAAQQQRGSEAERHSVTEAERMASGESSSGSGVGSGGRDRENPVGRPRGRPGKRRLHTETSVEDGTPKTVDIGGGAWEGYKAGMRAAAISAGMAFDDAALASWQKRKIDVVPATEAEEANRALKPDNGVDLYRWVESNVTTESPARARRNGYVLPRRMARNQAGRRELGRAKQHLVMWAAMARDGKVEAVAADGGLGLRAKTGLSVDLEIATAELCERVDLEATGLVIQTASKRGAAIGPAALANCSCLGCANARLEVQASGKVCLKVGTETWQKSIPAGGEVLIHHARPHGETWYCPVCRAAIVCAPDCRCQL